MRTIILGFFGAAAFVSAAYADRPVTAEEQEAVAEALEAQECEGGEIKFDDDGYFEVEDADCEDGAYDFKLNKSFEILETQEADDDDDDN